MELSGIPNGPEEAEDDFGEAIATFRSNLSEALGAPHVERQIAELYEAYSAVLVEAMRSPRLADQAARRYEPYARAVGDAFADAGARETLHGGFVAYVAALQQAWTAVDVASLEPHDLASIAEEMQWVAGVMAMVQATEGGGRMTALNADRTAAALDPANWDQFRALAHRMVDDLVDHLATIEERDVWRPVPDETRVALAQPVPRSGAPADVVYEEFLRHVRPYPRGNEHPRFWGWVNGSGLPFGILADLLAAGMNPSVGALESAASLVEQQVLDWLVELLDFPAGTSGVLTSGSSMSTIIGLAVARNARSDVDIRRSGVRSAGPVTSYTSVEAHSSVAKAHELLGLGADSLREVSVGPDASMDVDELARLVATDRQAGHRPLAVIATVGTASTGAIDPLERIAQLCSREQMWLHVDGAFGALAWLVPEQRPLLTGLQRADSLAFDLHKWLYLPYDIGCVLVRDAESHRQAFAHEAEYLKSNPSLATVLPGFPDLGIELSRRFRALKAWMCIKHHGIEALAEQIRLNLAQAAHLEALVRQSEHLELLAERMLNVVCFRYVDEGRSTTDLDRINGRIMESLWSSGLAVISHTRVGGCIALRAAITNHRTRFRDLELVVDEIERLGRSLGER